MNYTLEYNSQDTANYIELMIMADADVWTDSYFYKKILGVLPEKLSESSNSVFVYYYFADGYDNGVYVNQNMFIELYIKNQTDGDIDYIARAEAEAKFNEVLNKAIKGNKIAGYEGISIQTGAFPRTFPEEDGFFVISQPVRLIIRKNI